jgi:phage anti-repressor protein
MQQRNRKISLIYLTLLIISLFSGCATVNNKHPLVVSKEVKPGDPEYFAYAYFIRPKLYKSKGVADEAVRIEFQEKILLELDEGSYALLRIKPSKGVLKVFNETNFINKIHPVEVWRAREYKFIEGKTYFIHIKQIDEEYRGVFYDPEPVDFEMAKTLAKKPRASGEARNAPIETLKDIQAPPGSATGGLSPTLPENIYKKERYLNKQFY